MTHQLILIRGLHGSGKSTLARQYAAHGYRHYEADQYFMRGGEYRYRADKVHVAHRRCQERARASLRAGHNVVVANTFATRAEMKPYIEAALRYGCDVEIIEAAGDYGSIHNVPAAAIERMRARWEPIDQHKVV